MVTGFTFNGKHSIRDMGLVFKIKTRPVAQIKQNIEELQCIDGSMDFSDYLGRDYYSDKVLELDLHVKDTNPITLNNKISKIVRWLTCGYQDLIFDDMPSVIWTAKAYNVGAIAQEIQRVGSTTVQFRCKPFNKFWYNSNGIKISEKLKIGSEIPIGFSEDTKKDVSSGENTLVLNNYGDVHTKPAIEITGSFTSVQISDGTHAITYSGTISTGYPLKIDCETCVCMYKDADVTNNSSGEFLELAPGKNTIKITCAGSGKIKFNMDYNFLYDSDLHVEPTHFETPVFYECTMEEYLGTTIDENAFYFVSEV